MRGCARGGRTSVYAMRSVVLLLELLSFLLLVDVVLKERRSTETCPNGIVLRRLQLLHQGLHSLLGGLRSANRGILGCFGLGPCLLYLQGRLAHDVFARGAEDDFAVVLLILQRAAKERSTGVERRDDIFEIAARVVVIEFVKSSQVE